VVFALLPVGCRQPEPTEPNSVGSTIERGPFRLMVTATPTELWVGDPLTIELRVETPRDCVVRFPGQEQLGELPVRSLNVDQPRLTADGGLEWRQTLLVEPLRSGRLEIPALSVSYAQQPEGPDAEPSFEHELSSDPLSVTVRSALTTQDSVFRPRDITGTLLPPPAPLSAWAWAAIVAGVVLAAGVVAGLVVWLRRRARRPPPPVLPEIWALRALAELVVDDLLEPQRAREFYYRLSEIVRAYIERKFGLAAPEMTTEEFLAALARDRGVVPYDAERLRRFLEACDLVKYAAFQPRREDAEQALGTARALIHATAAAAGAGCAERRAPEEQAA